MKRALQFMLPTLSLSSSTKAGETFFNMYIFLRLNFRDAMILYQYLFKTYPLTLFLSSIFVSLFFWYHLVIPILIKEKELIMICLLIVFCVLQGRLFGTTNVMSYLKYKRNTKWYKICLCRSLQLSKIQGVPSTKQRLLILQNIARTSLLPKNYKNRP